MLLQGSSGLLDSVDRRGMILRRCYRGQEDRRWDVGEELRRGQSSSAAGPGEIPGEVRVVRGYKLLGRLPGTTTNLLRGLWELAVQWSSVLTAEQRRGEAEQHGGGG